MTVEERVLANETRRITDRLQATKQPPTDRIATAEVGQNLTPASHAVITFGRP